eukprot:TRINITY_DN112141_c0_g1_i1.p1 TRINITY_DN112141_c0_g1~~TRINITY_DN112141_c0_g1_i1.p1  ORF type:complete len:361 (+),score=69.87 TRINITY_DN112141_c0_g1_i1:69-1151(+)
MSSMLCQSYPRKSKTGWSQQARKSDLDEDIVEGEPSFIRFLKANSRHFRCFAFRSAFWTYCLDSGTLRTCLQEGMPAPVCERRYPRGSTCGGLHVKSMVKVNLLPALECEAIAAAHECFTPGLIFELHAKEDLEGDVRVSPEELVLLEYTNYGLVYTKPCERKTMARILLGHCPWQNEESGLNLTGTTCPAESFPDAGDEGGLLLQSLWVMRFRHAATEGGAWKLPMAYGIVPATAKDGKILPPTLMWHDLQHLFGIGKDEARCLYKKKVEAAVTAAAMSGCDALLVGCAEGFPGTWDGHVLPPTLAAEVWAEVLHMDGGKAPDAVNQQFKLIVFCLGGSLDGHRRRRTHEALTAAFGIS